MARKKERIENPDQLSFDFTFNRTLDTIAHLRDEMDTDSNPGENDAYRKPTTTPHRSENTQTNNHRSSPSLTISPAGLEDSRPMGIQQSREIANTGNTGRNNFVGTITGTATVRAQHIDPLTETEWLNGTRNSDQPRNQHRIIEATDYLITPADQLGDGGAKTKYRDNIAAINLLINLRTQQRAAVHDEQAILVRYVGWGGIPQVFDHRNESWKNEYFELSSLLSKEEYAQARRSTQDAHYTSEIIIEAIYKGLERIGFQGGRILEPSAGIGNFIGLMPQHIRSNSQFTAIELDPLTAEIARHLYPSATHINRGFQDVVIPTEYFDACIGNPPFGNQSLYDAQHRELSGFSIHNYFLAKSLDKLRAGGIMAFVVSRYFLDAKDATARAHIAEKAHFLGAIRLPNNAFKQNALTEVTTDIVFLQKTHPGEITDKEWVSVGAVRDYETGDPITLNHYFVNRPEQMIGRMAITNSMHRNTADLIPGPGLDLVSAIEQRITALPQGILIATKANNHQLGKHSEINDKPELIIPESTKIGSYFITQNNRIARRLPDVLDKHDYEYYAETQNDRTGMRIRGMVRLRETLRELMQAEQSSNLRDSDLHANRQLLNQVYDEFVRKFGYISSQTNRLAMSEDPEYPLLNALENDYDKGISAVTAKNHGIKPRAPSAKKAAIFSKRVMGPRKNVAYVETAKDALIVSMNESGRIDLSHMTRISGKQEDILLKELSGLIYLNPESSQWEIADQYLSGNVKTKLRIAEQAAIQNPLFSSNVNALCAIQPADIEPIDIAIQLGSTWVPSEIVDQFVKHLLGNVHCQITYQASLGKWLAKISPGDATTNHVTWGTSAYAANKIIEAILTNQAIQVKVETGIEPDGKKIYRVDEIQTSAASQKADEIKQAFLDWVWNEQERRDVLSTTYNELFNTNVQTKYDGAHLTLPGSSINITLRPHQKDAIWRGIQDGTALFDHVVGAGKTLICIGTIMESKRMGLMTKPMLVVPNHLLLQWKDAFYSLYPNANILVAEKSDFKKENRERLFSRIATGDWDAVIVAHSSFKKIGMPEETLHKILKEQIDDLSDSIRDLKNKSGDRLTIKEMEKARERMVERLERQANTGNKDQAVNFSDLGVDALVVDEAHEFKNLYITTTLNRVSGLGNLTGSEKAFDLFIKCRYLQEKNNGRGVFFATGTPISNTIAELYTMQRYLQYDELKARGIVHFDAWASTFGQVVTGWELDATGINYRLNSRFSKFQNVPELISLYRTFADVITKFDLDQQAKELGTRFPVPRIKGGKPQNIIVERSEEQAYYMGIQVPVLRQDGSPLLRADGLQIKEWNEGSIIRRMENPPKDPRIDNPLKITNDARKAGLDFRLVDPEAKDTPNSKLNTAVEHIYRIWDCWQERRGTQLVFCDLSTPKLTKKTISPPVVGVDDDADDLPSSSMDEILANHSKFSVYDDIKKKLIAKGIPEQEIRFIHEASTDIQKSKLFDEVNRGQVRVLLGSTAKMGAGMNVQRRLVAEHHLDAPWRPSDLEQREGRILRQGNLFYEQDPDHFEVEILRYATKQTYDSRMWQTIEYKASGIEQFRKGDSLQRTIEDVAGEAANAADMKAAATGNPLIFMQVQLSANLKKVEALFSNYKRNQHNLENRISWLANAGQRMHSAVTQWNKEIALRDKESTATFRFQTKDRIYGEKEREALHSEVMHIMKKAIEQQRTISMIDKNNYLFIGRYRGFNIQVYAGHNELQFVLSGSHDYKPENLRYRAEDKFNIAGFVHRIDNFISRFEEWRQQAKEIGEKEQHEYKKAIAEKEKTFPQQELLERLRQDVRNVMTELKLMQANDNYVSQWQPSSTASDIRQPNTTRMRA